MPRPRKQRASISRNRNIMAGLESSDGSSDEEGDPQPSSQSVAPPSSSSYSLRSTGRAGADGGGGGGDNDDGDDGYDGNGGGGGGPLVGMSQEDCEAYAKKLQLEVDHAAALEMQEEQCRAERANQIQSVLTNFFARGGTAPPEQPASNAAPQQRRSKRPKQPVQW